VRAYTRVIGEERQMYIGATFYSPDDTANVTRFIKSFTITSSKSKTTRN
jgi:hypothetical protein